MDAKNEIDFRKKLAISVQEALKNHRVNPENIGETADFLAHVLGGMIAIRFPEDKQRNEAIEALRKEIEFGMETGIPD